MISAIDFMKAWRNECKWHVHCGERAICYGCPIFIKEISTKSNEEINEFITAAIAKNSREHTNKA